MQNVKVKGQKLCYEQSLGFSPYQSVYKRLCKLNFALITLNTN
jgi:hypothetical protein